MGRAELDGSAVDKSFIGGAGAGIAVDANHVYWTEEGPPGQFSVARANLDGTGVNQSFISDIDSWGVAVDTSHVYWADAGSAPHYSDAGIARADLDGSDIDHDFIISSSPAYYAPIDVAIDANHVYWTQTLEFPNGAVGRANLDGTNVDQGFITATDGPVGVAVDGDHVYWTNYYTGTIGRANLDGSGVDQSFITGADNTTDVAVDGDHVYWAQHEYVDEVGWTRGRIGRANLDGTGVDQDLVTLGTRAPNFLAVDGFADRKVAGKASAAETQRPRGKRIRVRVNVKTNESLTARASGAIKIGSAYKLKPRTVELAGGETKTLKLKPKRKAQGKRIAGALKRGEKATAEAKVKLTDQAGNRETEKLRVRLKR